MPEGSEEDYSAVTDQFQEKKRRRCTTQGMYCIIGLLAEDELKRLSISVMTKVAECQLRSKMLPEQCLNQ